MPARTGAEYLRGLRERSAEVWLGNERVHDVTTHPALRRCARSVAHLYDMQHDPALRDEMTYLSPTSGTRVGLSFITPRSLEDLQRRSRMMLHWARYSGGMLGRSPDYLNVSLMAAAAAADFYGQNDPRFADNARNYYTYVRERDLCLTHTLVNPQANRALTATGHPSAEIAARIVKETDEGIIIRGARILATLGPLSDEIMVFPSTVLKGRRIRPLSRSPLPFPAIRRGSSSFVARGLTMAPHTSITPWARALRRWTRSSSSMTYWCRGSGCFSRRTPFCATSSLPRPTPSST